MMGERLVMQESLFYEFRLEDHVPSDHLLRRIDRFVDCSELRQHLAGFYSPTGRPSIDPELMIRMLLIGYCLGIGMTAAFFELTADLNPNLRGLHLLWEIAAGTAAVVVVIVCLASVMSLRRVLVLEPAVVFR